MNWWITQPSRAQWERAAIADLAERAEWLGEIHWRFDTQLALVVDFSVTVCGAAIPLSMAYPSFFPDAPPFVKSRERTLLSGHQYSAEGELCLEYRADNWLPTITGADMVESAHRLLAGESAPEAPPVPSAHSVTEGQALRWSTMRALFPEALMEVLESLPRYQPVQAVIAEHYYGQTWIARVQRIGSEEAPLWQAEPKWPGLREYQATLVCAGPADKIPAALSMSALATVLPSLGLTSWLDDMKDAHSAFLLIAGSGLPRLVEILGTGEDRKTYPYKAVALADPRRRTPEAYQQLADRSVGIVGGGSVGSKIAISLARSGVGSFVVIDPDYLQPQNLVRHQLDQRSVGVGKAEAIRQAILEVAPAATVIVRAILLGGQETASSTDAAMMALSQCDLIIDATADAAAFNVCAAVCRRSRTPMVWGSVFAGGIGGVIARSRPDLDPPPLAARDQISAWCAAHGVTWDSGQDAGYDGSDPDGNPMIADDADVSVIAAHLTRLATDVLVAGDVTAFPNSAYAIGLKSGWIFTAPFDTWPLDLQSNGAWAPEAEPDSAAHLVQLISDLKAESDES